AGLTPPAATDSPYGNDPTTRVPDNLGDALAALQEDTAMRTGFGEDFIRYYSRLKASEQQRYADAEDKVEFERREYFGRI
ncbi:MAG: Glutamine synthetase, partial [Pseudomonadota bacterium]